MSDNASFWTHRIAPVAIGLGFVLLALSWFGSDLVGRSAVWSDQAGQEYREAAAKLHRLAHENAHAETGSKHGDPPAATAELETTRQHYAQMCAKLEAARRVPEGTASMLKWTGTVILLLGVGSYGVGRWIVG